MVQGAKSGGGVSAPIAQRIMEQCLALDRGYDPGLVALVPAAGSLAPIDVVDYQRPRLPAPTGMTANTAGTALSVGTPVPFDPGDDPETLDSVDHVPRAILIATPRPRHPDIRPAPDLRGRIPLPPLSTPAPPLDNFHVLKPFFNPQR
jgi:hypothetical protein